MQVLHTHTCCCQQTAWLISAEHHHRHCYFRNSAYIGFSLSFRRPKAFGGKLVGIDHDCNDIPDAAMTLAVAALFAEGQTAIRGVYNWCACCLIRVWF